MLFVTASGVRLLTLNFYSVESKPGGAIASFVSPKVEHVACNKDEAWRCQEFESYSLFG